MTELYKLAKEHVAPLSVGFGYTSHSLYSLNCIEAAYAEGFRKARDLAVDRVNYSRHSIVLANNDFVRGYLQACKDICPRVQSLGEEESD